jgi:hypothetical protein
MIKIIYHKRLNQNEEVIAHEFSRIFNQLRLSYELHIMLHSEQLLPIIKKDPFSYDMIFLSLEDADFAETVLSCLRGANQSADVVLLDGSMESFRRVIKYKPSEWLSSKELLEEKLPSLMRYLCLLLQRSRNQSFFIRTKTHIIRIPYKNINYFESFQRQVILHGTEENSTYAFFAKLDEVEGKLPKNIFCRCHKSLIINFNNVGVLDKSMRQFILNSGEEVDISKAYYKYVLEQYEAYIKTY